MIDSSHLSAILHNVKIHDRQSLLDLSLYGTYWPTKCPDISLNNSKKKSWIINISRWRFIKKRNCSFRNISNIWLLAFVLRSQFHVAGKIWIVPGILKDSKGMEQNSDYHYYAIRALHLLINDYNWTMCYVIQNILAYTYLQLFYGWVTLN